MWAVYLPFLLIWLIKLVDAIFATQEYSQVLIDAPEVFIYSLICVAGLIDRRYCYPEVIYVTVLY